VGTGTGGYSQQGQSVALSADGNTAIVGGTKSNGLGAAWIFTRSNGAWTQQDMLIGTGGIGGTGGQGRSVSLSADGNTAIVGGPADNAGQGAAWIFTRNGSVWTQQGNKLVGTGNSGDAGQGWSVSLSADGNTAIIGGPDDNDNLGAAWVFTRNGSIWTQQGNKLVGTGNSARADQGYSVSLSADGNTAIVGGTRENFEQGAAWIFVRSSGSWIQQGAKLAGNDVIRAANQGQSVALSADGNLAIVGGPGENNFQGAVWIYARNGGIWTQQGSKLVGTGGTGSESQGYSVSLSADGSTAIVGGVNDNADQGAAWVYAPRPQITASGTLTAFTTCSGTRSAAQSFTVSGTLMQADLAVTAPAGYELSLSDGSGYAPAVSLAATAGQITTTTVYIRLSATAASGNYTETVTVTSANAVTQSLSLTGIVHASPSTPTISAGSATTFCSGGSVVLTSDAASGNSWYVNGSLINDASGATYTATTTGNYSVRVTDGNSCSSAASLPVAVTVNALPLTPTISAGGATTFCSGGSVVLTSDAASGNNWYVNGSLINGASGVTYTATTTGNYSVRVTDGNSCSSAASLPVAVTVNALPSTPAISAGSATTFCSGGSVVLTSDAANGNSWYINGSLINGASGTTYTATAAGNYSVRVTDGNSCSSAASLPVAVTVNALPSTPTISAGSATTFCAVGSVVLTSDAASGNSWYVNGSLISDASGSTYTETTTGYYSVRVTDGNSCSSAASLTVTVTVNASPLTPTISAGSATAFCSGGSVVLTSDAASGNSWYVNGSLINGASGTTYTATTSGDYSVRVTDGNSCNSAASLPVAVIVNALPLTPTISAGSATTFCSGGSVVLTSDAASGNSWYVNGLLISDASGTTYTATTSGDYSVRVTDGNSCNSAASLPVAVIVNALPSTPAISAGSATTFCSGGSVVLTSDAASGNSWYVNGLLISDASGATYTATTPGDYSVRVTDGNSCNSAASLPVTVTVNALPSTPIISAGSATTFCSGGSVVLTSDAASGNNWYVNGSLINGASGATYTATTAGNYSVRVTDGNGCASMASVSVPVTVYALPSTPTITAAGPVDFNTGGSVVLSSSAPNGNQWLLDGSPVNGASGISYTAIAAGNYSVRVIDGNHCVSADATAVKVTVNSNTQIPTPTINAAGATVFCSGGSVVLVSSAASGNQWLLNGAAINGATGTNYTAVSAGNYSVRVTNGNNNTSADATPVTVTVKENPAIPVITAGGATTICAGSSVVLNSNAGAGNQWLLNGVPVNGATGQTYRTGAGGSYTLRVTNTGNCSSTTVIATAVTVNALPAGNISQVSLARGVVAGFTLTAPAGVTYKWNTGENTASIKAQASGNYSVTVTNALHCQNQFTTQVVLPAKDNVEKISLPNTFSPNGDGVNDYWTVPDLQNYPMAQVTIVNRSGAVVYQSNNTMPKWDGRYKGKDLPAGVYFYKVQPLPGVALKTGWINLIR
jgi:gliding motility-associated-like protein